MIAASFGFGLLTAYLSMILLNTHTSRNTADDGADRFGDAGPLDRS